MDGTSQAAIGRQPAGIYAGWKVVVLAFLLLMLNAGPIYYAYSVYSESFAQNFGAPRTLINLAFTAALMVSGALAGMTGWLAARWDLRLLAATGCLLAGSGVALAGFATAMWQVVLIYGTFIALADGLMGTAVCNGLLARWFERRRGLAIGLAVTGISAAAIIYPPLTSFLTAELGWRTVFFIHGATILALTPLVLHWGRGPKEGIAPLEQKARGGDDRPEERPALTTKALLSTVDFWAITLPVGALMGLSGAVLVSLVPFAVGQNIDQTQAALLISAIGGAALVGKLTFGFAADHVDLRVVLRLAMAAGVAAFALLCFAEGYVPWLAAVILFGLSFGGMLPVWGAIMAQVFGPGYVHAMGWSRTVMTPITFGCPLLAGAVFDLTGGYELAWKIYLALTVIALLATFARGSPR